MKQHFFNKEFSHQKYSSPGKPSFEDPLDPQLESELRRKVLGTILGLHLPYKQVVRLFYLEGWTCAQIAEALDLSVFQVEKQLFRGRARLKKVLQPSLNRA